MPRITKVYTRTGDDGTTGLGIQKRVAKDDPRVEAYGSVDELSSVLGVALAAGVAEALREPLLRVQNDLFHLGSDLCIPEEDKQTLEVPTIEQRHVDALEAWMDEWSERLEPLANFILPGGTPAAAHPALGPHRLPPCRAALDQPRGRRAGGSLRGALPQPASRTPSSSPRGSRTGWPESKRPSGTRAPSGTEDGDEPRPLPRIVGIGVRAWIVCSSAPGRWSAPRAGMNPAPPPDLAGRHRP